MVTLTFASSTISPSDVLMRKLLSRTTRPSNCILCSAWTSGATSPARGSCEKVGSRVEKSAVNVAPLVQALQRMQFDGLVVRDSSFRIKTSDGEIVELANVNVTISSKPNGAVHCAGAFDFRGDRSWGFSPSIRLPSSVPFSGAPNIDGARSCGSRLARPKAIFSPRNRSNERRR